MVVAVVVVVVMLVGVLMMGPVATNEGGVG